MKKIILSMFLLLSVLVACSSGSGSDSIAIDDVIDKFNEEGLEAEDVTEMTKDDYGMAPMKAEEAKRFLIPSLGEDSGGRIFSYDNQKDLNEMKEYYDSLGEESAMFFSWTADHENILIQINGELSEEKYEEYKAALESM